MEKAMNRAYEGDLYLIMMAVQKSVDEMLPPNEMGHYAASNCGSNAGGSDSICAVSDN
jgi:hypothetical protein